MNHATMSLGSNLLLMTCRVRMEAADASGFCVISVSIVSEHFAQRLHLSWYSQNTDISGFEISSIHSHWKFSVTTVIMPCVTCDLQMHP